MFWGYARKRENFFDEGKRNWVKDWWGIYEGNGEGCHERRGGSIKSSLTIHSWNFLKAEIFCR